MDRLFVAYKSAGVSSNNFLTRIKRQYGVKKAGYSGTLDPFAKGCLVVAFGRDTRLFRFLQTAPKLYRATLWLGAESRTLDTEGIESVEQLPHFEESAVKEAVESLTALKEMRAPKFSAKHVDGKRAYDLARAGQEFELPSFSVTIYDSRLIHYRHPFATFEVSASEGTYVRTLGGIVADKLSCTGSLCALERIGEGKFRYDRQKPLDVREYLKPAPNAYLGDFSDIMLGKKIPLEMMQIREDGEYLLSRNGEGAIIEIKEGKVSYLLNNLEFNNTLG